MRLSQLFDLLNYGELSQLSITGNDQGIIDQSNQAAIITHLNLALLELYKRFPIKTGEVTVQTLSYLSDYRLDSRYAYTNPYQTDDIAYPKYIMDTPFDPFTDDVLVIEEVADEAGDLYTVNDENDCNSIMIMDYNAINVANPGLEAALFVQYRAAPPKIDPNTTLSYDEIVVPITDQYLEPLLNYIAYRSFAAFNMNNPEAVSYYAKFEASCGLIRQEGLRHKVARSNEKLECNGWV